MTRARWSLALALLGAPACLIEHDPGPSAPAIPFEAPARPTVPAADTLRAAGAKFRPFNPRPARPTDQNALPFSCAVEEGVAFLKGPSGLRYNKPPLVNGAFAVRLLAFETALQDTARSTLGTSIKRVNHLGSYVCRAIAGTAGASEHATGNALDVASFVTADGRTVDVGQHWVPAGDEPRDARGRFLRALSERLRRDRVFGTILTPDHDDRHASHLHLDGRRWWPYLW